MQQPISSQQLFSSSVLQVRTLKDVRTQLAETSVNMEIIRWLLWLPLLCKEELVGILDQPSSSTYKQLACLQQFQLLDYVVFQEPGEANRRRYYVTDTGLYLFGEQCTPPLQPEHLAHTYSMGEEDVLHALIHSNTHKVLTTIISRLVTDGRALGYNILELEHPYSYSNVTSADAKRIFFHANARLLLTQQQPPDASSIISDDAQLNQSYSFCLLIEIGESLEIRRKEERGLLQNLLKAYQTQGSTQTPLPLPLLVTTRDRLATWGSLLQQIQEQYPSQLLTGGVTTMDRLEEGIYTPIWYSFDQLAQKSSRGSQQQSYLHTIPPSLSLQQLLAVGEQQTSQIQDNSLALSSLAFPEGVKTSSQRRKPTSLFRHLDDETLLPVYIRGGFQERARLLQAKDLAAEQVRNLHSIEAISTLAALSLRLTPVEKEMIALLAHHPLLSRIDLANVLTTTARTTASIREHMNTLLTLGLVQTHLWREGLTSEEQIRYSLTEPALLFLAARFSIPPSYYLVRRGLHRWEQRGVAGLLLQLNHTAGVYRCIFALLRIARETGMIMILRWKSARESVRWYTDEQGSLIQLRPDSELHYCVSEGSLSSRSLLTTAPLTIFLEYDRATVKKRDHRSKFACYLDYWNATGKKPPLIVVVTQNGKTVQDIQESIEQISNHLDVLVILEEQFLPLLVLTGSKRAS